MEYKYTKQEIDFNLYVINKLLECIINYLPVSKKYNLKLIKLMNDIQNDIYNYPKEFHSLDIADLKYEITTYFEEFIPYNKSDNHADL